MPALPKSSHHNPGQHDCVDVQDSPTNLHGVGAGVGGGAGVAGMHVVWSALGTFGGWQSVHVASKLLLGLTAPSLHDAHSVSLRYVPPRHLFVKLPLFDIQSAYVL